MNKPGGDSNSILWAESGENSTMLSEKSATKCNIIRFWAFDAFEQWLHYPLMEKISSAKHQLELLHDGGV